MNWSMHEINTFNLHKFLLFRRKSIIPVHSLSDEEKRIAELVNTRRTMRFLLKCAEKGTFCTYAKVPVPLRINLLKEKLSELNGGFGKRLKVYKLELKELKQDYEYNQGLIRTELLLKGQKCKNQNFLSNHPVFKLQKPYYSYYLTKKQIVDLIQYALSCRLEWDKK